MLIFSCCFLFSFKYHPQKNMPAAHSYLALGDSYTIGESVPSKQNFPNQLVDSLKKNGHDFLEPEIVAKTGWTTDELQAAIDKHHFNPPYDLVTLLIGVNNQYRGRTVEDYAHEFESLLLQAIAFAGGKTEHVVVLSIPDWGATPFAEGRNREEIAKQIDTYNAANRAIASLHHIQYIDITPGSREAATDPSLITSDGLHPSAKEYARWVEKLVQVVK